MCPGTIQHFHILAAPSPELLPMILTAYRVIKIIIPEIGEMYLFFQIFGNMLMDEAGFPIYIQALEPRAFSSLANFIEILFCYLKIFLRILANYN
jgi:hypothetical protein